MAPCSTAPSSRCSTSSTTISVGARRADRLVGFALLYGLWGAAFFGLAALAPIPFPRPERRRGLLLGLLFFNLFFWELFFLYGLTYDQAPLHPTAKWGMAGVLPPGAAIALGAALGSWLLFRLFVALRRAGVLGWAATGLFSNTS